MKKGIIAGIAIFCSLMFAGSALAAWDTCGIERLGVTGTSDNLIKVTSCDNGGNNGKWLTLVNQKDTSMATLLTAFSLNKRVKFNADFVNASKDGSVYGVVWTLYLNN